MQTCFAISGLVLVTLIGCSAGVPASPIATQTNPSSAVVEPTVSPSAAITPAIVKGFSIYLLADSKPTESPAVLDHLDLESRPVLTIDDIVTYAKATHEIELTSAGYERMHGLRVPTNGIAFAVCVDGEPIYRGAFWAAYSSQSFNGIVIDPTLATAEHPVIQIRLGYPVSDLFHWDDPRSDPRILQALEQAGKLK